MRDADKTYPSQHDPKLPWYTTAERCNVTLVVSDSLLITNFRVDRFSTTNITLLFFFLHRVDNVANHITRCLFLARAAHEPLLHRHKDCALPPSSRPI